MSKVTLKEWYRRVNAAWPADVPIPTDLEAIRGACKLYRYALGNTFSAKYVRLTSGNRYTWVKRGLLHVNPNRPERGVGGGWQALVHDLSHYFHRRINPGVRPHGAAQARLELRLIKQVVKRGWLDGALKDDTPPTVGELVTQTNEILRDNESFSQMLYADTPVAPLTKQQLRYARILNRITKWEAKAKRAQKALKKLARQRAYYERTLQK